MRDSLVHAPSPLGASDRFVARWHSLALLAVVMAGSVAVQCGGKSNNTTAATPATVEVAQNEVATHAATEAESVSTSTSERRAFQATSEEIPVGHWDPVSGKGDALVTLVEFLDFECPFSGRVQATLKQLRGEYEASDLRIVVKHNPLPFHKAALPAARAAQAVFVSAGDDAFFAYMDLMFQHQRDLTEDNFELWANQVGAPEGQFWNTWESAEVLAKVESDMDLARAIGARGTPNFRINGIEVSGAQPYNSFKTVIDAELKQAHLLLQARVPRGEIYTKRVAENYAESPPVDYKPPPSPPEDKTIWKVEIGSAPTRGPADALVTIIEFGDYQCPFCGRVQATLKELEKKYPGQLRFVFKHNALPFHQRAMPAAMLAIEAQQQRGEAGFWDVHQRLWASQKALEDADLLAIAKAAGLNSFRTKRAITNLTHQALVQQDMDQASDFKARGIPHFFINGRRLAGALPIEKFVEVVEEQLDVAEQLVRQGTPRRNVYAEIMKTAKSPPPLPTKKVPAPSKSQPSRGPANAPVVVQMFSEYQCPFCKRVLPTIEQLQKEFPKEVRVVWRDLPLPFHKDAPLAAEAAREAFAQRGHRGYWAMHELLFKNQAVPDGLKRPAIESYAAQLGLNMKRFKAALDNGTHRGAVDADAAIAKQAGIQGTPGFVINGYFVSGAQPLSAFRKAVKQALDDAKKGKTP